MSGFSANAGYAEKKTWTFDKEAPGAIARGLIKGAATGRSPKPTGDEVKQQGSAVRLGFPGNSGSTGHQSEPLINRNQQ